MPDFGKFGERSNETVTPAKLRWLPHLPTRDLLGEEAPGCDSLRRRREFEIERSPVIGAIALHDVVTHALVFAGACALVLGPALQAKAELQEYEDLIQESGVDAAMKTSLSLLLSSMRPFPFGLVGLVKNGVKLVRQVYAIEKWFRGTEEQGGVTLDRARLALVKARNWGVVMVGAVLVLVASGIDLAVTAYDYSSR